VATILMILLRIDGPNSVQFSTLLIIMPVGLPECENITAGVAGNNDVIFSKRQACIQSKLPNYISAPV